jgi:hypothetical protein
MVGVHGWCMMLLIRFDVGFDVSRQAYVIRGRFHQHFVAVVGMHAERFYFLRYHITFVCLFLLQGHSGREPASSWHPCLARKHAHENRKGCFHGAAHVALQRQAGKRTFAESWAHYVCHWTQSFHQRHWIRGEFVKIVRSVAVMEEVCVTLI